jgi:glucose/mannose transport system substrate-binding protein
MKKSIALAATALALLWSGSAVAQELKAEVIHWWTSGGESAAVKVFADQFKKAGGTWIDSAIAGGSNARTAAINRTVAGNPPTMMQFNTGKQFDDLVENGLLNDVEKYATEYGWKKVLPQAILDATTRNGKMYAVPVNIHAQNWFWISNAALAKAGAKVPTNWTDLFETLDKLKAAGLIPLALGGQKTWERTVFNVTLAGQGGAKMFQDFWGKRDLALLKTPEFKAVADSYAKLRGYVDAGSPGRNWNDATTLVIQGKAGMEMMGDWAKGEFIAAGQQPGKDYTCLILSNFPAPAYTIGGDVFAFPKTSDPAALKAQGVLAKVLLDPETQILFNQKKGSIPVRSDVDASTLDPCAQQGMKIMANKDSQVPAQELLAPPALSGAMEDVLSQFWNTPSMKSEDLIAKIAVVLGQQY